MMSDKSKEYKKRTPKRTYKKIFQIGTFYWLRRGKYRTKSIYPVLIKSFGRGIIRVMTRYDNGKPRYMDLTLMDMIDATRISTQDVLKCLIECLKGHGRERVFDENLHKPKIGDSNANAL